MNNYNKKIPRKYFIPLYGIFLSLMLFSIGNFYQNQNLGLSILNRIIGLMITNIYILYFFLKIQKVRKKLPLELKFYGILLISIALSIFLSDMKGYSLWKTFEVSTDYLFILYLWNLSLIYKKEVYMFFYKKYINFLYFLILTVIISILIDPNNAIKPPTAYGHALLPYQIFGTLIKLNADSIGMISAILFYINFVRFFESKSKRNMFLLIILFIVLIFSQSRTAILGLFIVTNFYLLFNKSIKLKWRYILLIFLFSVILINIDIIVQYLHRGLTEEQIKNLSGRKIWWYVSLKIYFNADFIHQMFGFGFVSGNRWILTNFLNSPSASTLHSDYIDILISNGAFGIILFILFIITIIVKIIIKLVKYRKDSFFWELAGVSLLLIIRSFTGTTFVTHNIFLPFMFIIIVLYNEFYKKEYK